MVKGRTRPNTLNRHLYIKKKDGLTVATLRKGKLSLPQAWIASLQESSRLANFTWHCRAMTLVAEVREDRYFRTSSFTHSKPTTAGGIMVTQHCGYVAHGGHMNVPTTTRPCFPRNRRGENYCDGNKFPNQRSSGRLRPPMEVRSVFTSTT